MEKSATTSQETSKDRNSIKEYFELGEMWGYFFRKKDPSRPSNFNIRMMHGINRISILVFLAGMLFFILKHFL